MLRGNAGCKKRNQEHLLAQTNPNFLGVVLKAEIEKWLKCLVLERKNIFFERKIKAKTFF